MHISDDPDCPTRSKVKCNYKYDIPCSTTSDCARKGRRNQICCPDEGGHPVCTPRRPGSCPYVRTRHCRARNTDRSVCSTDKDCPLPAKCCMNSQCKKYCEFNPVLGRGYAGWKVQRSRPNNVTWRLCPSLIPGVLFVNFTLLYVYMIFTYTYKPKWYISDAKYVIPVKQHPYTIIYHCHWNMLLSLKYCHWNIIIEILIMIYIIVIDAWALGNT